MKHAGQSGGGDIGHPSPAHGLGGPKVGTCLNQSILFPSFVTYKLCDLGHVISSLSLHLFRRLRMISAKMSDRPPGHLVRIKWEIMDVRFVNHIPLYKEKSLLLMIMTLPTGNGSHLGAEVGRGCLSVRSLLKEQC